MTDTSKSEVSHSATNGWVRLYESRDKRLVIEAKEGSGEIRIGHDLTRDECPKYRLRAINTLTESIAEQDEIVEKYAPGAKTRRKAERTRELQTAALNEIKSLWPEADFGHAPSADPV